MYCIYIYTFQIDFFLSYMNRYLPYPYIRSIIDTKYEPVSHLKKRIFYRHDWIFLKAEKDYHVLGPNNYTWDFEFVLPGTLPETIEHPQIQSYIKYNLKATVERYTCTSALN